VVLISSELEHALNAQEIDSECREIETFKLMENCVIPCCYRIPGSMPAGIGLTRFSFSEPPRNREGLSESNARERGLDKSWLALNFRYVRFARDPGIIQKRRCKRLRTCSGLLVLMRWQSHPT